MLWWVQHVNAQGAGDTVNRALGVSCLAYLHKGSSRSYPPQGGTEMSPGRPVRHAVAVSTAPCVATCRVIGQESAETIVGEGHHHEGAVVIGNELGE
jgi:hypothetical protein